MTAEAARKLFYTWSLKEANPKPQKIEIEWPDEPVAFAEATALSYRSGKWKEGKAFDDYIHEFSRPYPTIWMDRSDLEGGWSAYLRRRPLARNVPSPRPSAHLTQLGLGLELQFRLKGEDNHFDFPLLSPPRLLADPTRLNTLFLVPLAGGKAWIIASPQVVITARGIEN